MILKKSKAGVQPFEMEGRNSREFIYLLFKKHLRKKFTWIYFLIVYADSVPLEFGRFSKQNFRGKHAAGFMTTNSGPFFLKSDGKVPGSKLQSGRAKKNTWGKGEYPPRKWIKEFEWTHNPKVTI